jgi:deoxyadenosine/deoxycytidine kinase
MALSKPLICLAGLIGSGKTNLSEKLGKVFNLPVLYERVVNNIYLESFYLNMKAYSFKFQIYLLKERIKLHQQLIWNGSGGIMDRSIYEDDLFCRVLVKSGMMENRDYECYVDMVETCFNFMRKPTLLIYLDVKPEEALRRIKLRGRECEKDITLEYLTNLYIEYQSFIKRISKTVNVISVDWSEFQNEEEVAKKIWEEYAKIENIRVIKWEKIDVLSLPKIRASQEVEFVRLSQIYPNHFNNTMQQYCDKINQALTTDKIGEVKVVFENHDDVNPSFIYVYGVIKQELSQAGYKSYYTTGPIGKINLHISK